MSLLPDCNLEAPPAVEDTAQTDWLSVATVLASDKRFILKWTALAAVVGVGVAFVIPARYTSSAKILPPERVPSTAALFSEGGAAGVAGLALGGGGASLLRDPNDQYIALLKTRPVADSIIQKFDLEKVYSLHDLSSTRKRLESATTISAGRENMITISVIDRDRKRAAGIANAYVDGLKQLTATLALTEASRRRVFFEQQLEASKQNLANAEIALRKVQEKTGVVAMDVQAKTTIDVAGELRSKIATKELEVQSLASFATEQNFQLQLAKRELAALRAQLAEVDQSNGAGDPLNISVRRLPKTQQELLQVTREEKYQEAVYAMLGRQLEAARLDESRDAPIVQVIESAIPADRKTSPHRSFVAAGFLFAGLFLSSLVVFTRYAVGRASGPRRQMLRSLKKAFTTW